VKRRKPLPPLVVLLLALAIATAGSALAEDRSFSSECREAAAHRWLVDVALEHGTLSLEQQLHAISTVTGLAVTIRRTCGYDWVNQEIARAAKLGFQPAWIKPQIAALREAARPH
jgi:hypothetical protein